MRAPGVRGAVGQAGGGHGEDLLLAALGVVAGVGQALRNAVEGEQQALGAAVAARFAS